MLLWHRASSPAASLYERGKQLAAVRLYDDARDLFTQAIQRDPRYAPPYRELAEMEASRGALEDSIASWQRYVALAPSGPHGWCGLARAEMATGRFSPALEHAERELKIDPNCGEAQLIAGLAYERRSQAAPALLHLEQAHRLLPQRATAGLAFGRVLALSGQFNKAADVLSETQSRYPEMPEPSRWLGYAYLRMPSTPENRRKAEQSLRRALQIRPSYAEANCDLAKLYVEEGRAAEALPPAQQAIAARKHYPNALLILAQAHAALGHAQEALKARQQFQRESELATQRAELIKRYRVNPGDPSTALALSRVLLDRDEASLALRYLQDAESHAPGDTRIRTALKEAERLEAERHAPGAASALAP